MLAVSGNFKGAALDNQVGSQVVCPLDGVDAGAIATGKSIEESEPWLDEDLGPV